jgi:hypothetical protein
MSRVIAWLHERMPRPHPSIEEIVTWCDEESGAADARRIAMHLVTCDRCRRHAELLHEAREQTPLSVTGRRNLALDDLLRNLRANMRAWRHLQGRVALGPRSSGARSAINRRIAAAVTMYFGARAAVHLERSAESDERHLFPASQALFSAFLGKRAADALARQIVGTIAS